MIQRSFAPPSHFASGCGCRRSSPFASQATRTAGLLSDGSNLSDNAVFPALIFGVPALGIIGAASGWGMWGLTGAIVGGIAAPAVLVGAVIWQIERNLPGKK